MHKEFKEAVLLRMAKLLKDHVHNTSPDTVYSYDEICILLRQTANMYEEYTKRQLNKDLDG